MGMLDRLTSLGPVTAALEAQTEAAEADLADDNAALAATVEHLQESLASVELALEDRGWQTLTMQAQVEFSRDGLRRAAELARIMAVVNPLIRRGLNLRVAYIWGTGVEISARAAGPTDDNAGAQDVNAVVQAFLSDRANRKVLTGPAARERNERALGTDGNLFFACFTERRAGTVQVRSIPFNQVEDVISNPEDATEPWFYKRVHVNASGASVTTYYPDIDHRPKGARPIRVDGVDVAWDSPVIHLKVNDLDDWEFGIGDAYTAISWARAYKEFLEDWAKLVKALSRFAWRATGDRRSKAQAMASRAKQAASANARTGEANDIGAMVAMGPGQSLEAIPKTGATIDSESGKPLAALIAAGMDVPLTMLLADPGVTGARATAETLDRPTELMAGMRRDVWADFFDRLLGYVVDQAVKAPAGPLAGTVARDGWGREVVTLAGDTERTIEIVWPDLTETSIDVLMSALEKADGMGIVPDLEMLKLVLAALGLRDVDEILEQVKDEDGNFVRPDVTAGQAAVDAHRRGEDSAEALR